MPRNDDEFTTYRPQSIEEWERREDELELRQARAAARAIGASYDDALGRAVRKILSSHQMQREP